MKCAIKSISKVPNGKVFDALECVLMMEFSAVILCSRKINFDLIIIIIINLLCILFAAKFCQISSCFSGGDLS